ncbi:MAG TPA: transposase [Beijerinckiaceae bacterium]|nr:transposase [Hyphomicrobiales bacterium]MCO5086041.1 transposase [Methylobacteriaceae bacterium]HRY01583.1 transposase [Beijerinckiaceae bacterium]
MQEVLPGTVFVTYSYRVKDAGSGKRLQALATSVNQVWNFINEVSMKSARRGQRHWAPKKLLRDLTKGAGKMIGLPSQVVQEVIDQYVVSRREHGRAKLRWRVSFGTRRTLGWIPFTNQDIALVADMALLRGQKFRIWRHRDCEGRIKSGNFSQDARGRWYVNLVCEVPRRFEGGYEINGVDLGLKRTATASNGEALDQARFYRDLEGKLAEAQRRGSKRQVKTISAKVSNRRKDALHKFSRALVKRSRAIFVGDISASGQARSGKGKSVLDAGWATLRRMLRYKCDRAGASYGDVNEAWTTQTCSSCLARSGPKGREELGVRRWVCELCGGVHDRDVNAALNIARLGCETLGLK